MYKFSDEMIGLGRMICGKSTVLILLFFKCLLLCIVKNYIFMRALAFFYVMLVMAHGGRQQ